MGKIVAFDKYSKEINDEKDGSLHRINIVRQNVGKSRGNVNLMLRETGGLLTGQYIVSEPINFVRYTVYMEDFLDGRFVALDFVRVQAYETRLSSRNTLLCA